MICNLFSPPTYILFSSDVPALLYYSHIPTAIIALLVGIAVYINGRKVLLHQLLFSISLSFVAFTVINLFLWTNINSDLLLFLWSYLRVLSCLISVLSIYFAYTFILKHDVSMRLKSILLAMVVPVFLLAPTNLNVSGFDITNCDAYFFQGVLFKFFHIGFGVVAMVWILLLLLKHYSRAARDERAQMVLMGLGIELFLFSHFVVIFLAGYLTTHGILADSRLEMYSFLGMVFFMGMLAALMVRYKAFNTGLIASNALVIALVILNGSLVLVVKSFVSQVIAVITLLSSGTLGYFLIRSVRQEIELRQKTERLARYLANANARLRDLDQQKTEFVSIASHQLRSPTTAISWQASLILEGSYGPVPDALKPQVARLLEAGKSLAMIVDDFLNVTRIEQGHMSFNMERHNVYDIVHSAVEDLRVVAQHKGLTLTLTEAPAEPAWAHCDIDKLKQIFSNLVDNAIKYTPQGGIEVRLRTDTAARKVFVDISDTGIGIAPDDVVRLFHKFNRGSNANTANVHGTGLGLYIAKEIMKAHEGWIHVASEGVGKGSTFTVELPMAPEASG